MVYKVKLLTQMLEERHTLNKVQHIKLSSDRTTPCLILKWGEVLEPDDEPHETDWN